MYIAPFSNFKPTQNEAAKKTGIDFETLMASPHLSHGAHSLGG